MMQRRPLGIGNRKTLTDMRNDFRKYKITVVGTGYVGMSLAVLLAQHNNVTALDIDAGRVDLINQGKSTVVDAEIEHYLADKELSLAATLDKAIAYRDPVFVVVATPTDYDPETNYFDTSSVEAVIGDVLEHNDTAMIIIKSTVPVGFTRSMKENSKRIGLFSRRNSCARDKH